jgi:hypothetical protein
MDAPVLDRRCTLLALLVAACDAPTTGLAALRHGDFRGSYAYRAYHEDGRLLLRGTLTFSGLERDTMIHGSWTIAWAPGADTTAIVGPQLGSGVLVGALRGDGGAWFDLTPNYADNNVGLLGAGRAGDAIRGSWSHTTFIGPVAGGRFELVR